MNYAIVQISGRQFWVEPKKYYIVNHLPFERGTKLLLKRVLVLNKEKMLQIGYPYLNGTRIEAIILSHFKNKKLVIYKMKPKKKYRKKNGYRQKLTRLLINKM